MKYKTKFILLKDKIKHIDIDIICNEEKIIYKPQSYLSFLDILDKLTYILINQSK